MPVRRVHQSYRRSLEAESDRPVNVAAADAGAARGDVDVANAHLDANFLRHRQEKSAGLIRRLWALDYRLYWHLPPLFNPSNFFGETQNVFGKIVSVNMLGMHASVAQNVTGLREVIDADEPWNRKPK